MQQIYQFISDNFDGIVQGDNFKHLSKDEVLSLFTNLDRNTVQESSLYTAAVNWIKFDENREMEFSSLFLCLDLTEFLLEFVTDTVTEEQLVKQNVDCLNAVVSYLVNKIKNMNRDQKESRLLSVGGGKSTNFVVEVFSVFGDLLKIYPDLPCNLTDHCVLKVDNFVFCIGGNVDGNWKNSTNQVYQLNLRAPMGWDEVPSMIENRGWFGAAVCNGCLVVAGGCNRDSVINTTELYEPQSKRWRTIAPLNSSRYELGLVVEDQKLFAIGGRIGHQCLSTVEQLDDLNGKWKVINSMNQKRSRFAAVACNNFIYAIGGWEKLFKTVNKTVEKYDVNNNSWSFVSSMNKERWCHTACVLQGKIYVVGGLDANNAIVKTIECYDLETDEWTVVGETKQGLCRQALIAV